MKAAVQRETKSETPPGQRRVPLRRKLATDSVAASSPPMHAPTATQRRFGHSFARVSVLDRVQAPIQTKLTIGPPDDEYEREADAVAARVVSDQYDGRTPNVAAPTGVQKRVQRQMTSNPPDMEEKLKEEMQIRRKGDGMTPSTPPTLEQHLGASAGRGRPLPNPMRTRMEESFGADFERVRIHTDGEAASLSRQVRAEAFTYGNDVYFGAGRFNDRTKGGTELLAHELTHTLQQQGVRRKTIQRRGGPKVGDLSVRTNVISEGLTAGHAWLSYTPVGGSETTYGTWGNRTPIGLHRDLEVGAPYKASRATELDSGDLSSLTSFASANNAWTYTNNCASFAARGWLAVAGESLSYTSMWIPNPSALGAGIVAANGGATGTLPTAPVAAPTPSSSGSSI